MTPSPSQPSLLLPLTPPTCREPEEVIEPELPICDPHHHLWDHRKAINDFGIRPYRQGVYTLLEILEDVNVRTRPTAALVGWGGWRGG